MAAVSGVKTSIRIGSTIVNLQDGFNLSITMNNPEYASFGSTFGSCLSALKKWTATSKGTLERTTGTGQATIFDQLESGGTAADVALRFYTTTGNVPYWGGNARIDSASIDSAVDDKVNVSFNFKGNGAITYTTST